VVVNLTFCGSQPEIIEAGRLEGGALDDPSFFVFVAYRYSSLKEIGTGKKCLPSWQNA
jgi:hypothetical protein